MHRPGADLANMQMADILCDFCTQPWSHERPMVEGHRGSCICGRCLTVAYTALVIHEPDDGEPPAAGCTLCLEQGARPHWQSPLRDEAAVCLRCVKQAAGVLHKDPESPWRKPSPDR